LHNACVEGRPLVAERLINNGANLELRNKDGRTPFLNACHSNLKQESIEVLELLILKGVDTNALTSKGSCAVFLAAHSGKLKTIEFLFSKKLDLNHRNKEGFSPIMIACKLGHLSTVKCLFKLGAKIDIKSEKGKSCLMIAA
jgi:ankyrin repeat protein